MYTIKDLENDPNWKSSVGEKLDKVHFRNGHYHAECDPKTGFCKVHYDEDDPHESITSLFKHLVDSKSGKGLLAVGGVIFLDQIFTGGKIRKSIVGI